MNNDDASILYEKLTEKDIQFIAEIMISPDDSAWNEIEKARIRLPGHINCLIINRIYDAVNEIIRNNNDFTRH